MIKRNQKTVLFAALALLCTAFIFSNSFKNVEASRADSDVIVEIVEKLDNKVTPNHDLAWNDIVRKGAHFAEFCILGILTALLWLQICPRRKATVALAFAYVTAVAFTDEWIQRFTGRGSQLKDVGLDVLGAYIGIALVLLLWCGIRYMKRGPRQART